MVLIELRVDEQNPEARKAARSARFGEEAPNYDPAKDAVLQSFEQDAEGAESSDEVAEVQGRPRPPPVQCRRMPGSGSQDLDVKASRGLESHGSSALVEMANGSTAVASSKRRRREGTEEDPADPLRSKKVRLSKNDDGKGDHIGYGYRAQPARPVSTQKGHAVPELTPEPEPSPPPAGGASSSRRLVLRSRSRSPPGRHEQLKEKLQRLKAEAKGALKVRRGDDTASSVQFVNLVESEANDQNGGSKSSATPPGIFSAGSSHGPGAPDSDTARPKKDGQESFHKSASRARAPTASEAALVSGVPPGHGAGGHPQIPARPPPSHHEQPVPARGPAPPRAAPPPAPGWQHGYPPHALMAYPPAAARSMAPLAQPIHPAAQRLYAPVPYGYLPYMAAVPGYPPAVALHHAQAFASGSDSASSSRSNSPARKQRRPKDPAPARGKKKKKARPRLKKKPTPDPEPTLEEQGLWVGGVPGPLGISQEKLGWSVVVSDEHRRTFISYRKGAFSETALAHWWKVLSDQIPWRRPPPPASKRQLEDEAEEEKKETRLFPRSACWLTQSNCNCTYEYSGTRWDPISMPTWFDEITECVCQSCNLRDRPNCCNANYYEHGKEAVGWHADDEPLFASTERDVLIVSLSLGETRNFELHPMDAPERVTTLQLEDGDLCTMEGLCQKHYRHRVPPDLKHLGPRINLTWRWILNHQPDCPAAR